MTIKLFFCDKSFFFTISPYNYFMNITYVNVEFNYNVFINAILLFFINCYKIWIPVRIIVSYWLVFSVGVNLSYMSLQYTSKNIAFIWQSLFKDLFDWFYLRFRSNISHIIVIFFLKNIHITHVHLIQLYYSFTKSVNKTLWFVNNRKKVVTQHYYCSMMNEAVNVFQLL